MSRWPSVPGKMSLNLAALGLGLAAAVGLTEIALIWLMPPPVVYREPQPAFAYDPRLGWRLQPGQRSFTLAEPVSTNRLGFRSPELSPAMPPGGIRILCLGDSQTFGNGVSQSKTYPARLQQILSTRLPGRPVEAVNAGVPGYDTLQEVDLLERMLPDLDPDVVIIGVYLNDISEAVYPDKSEVMDKEKGTFRRQGATRLLSERTIHRLKRSRLITFLYWQLRQLRARGEAGTFYLPLQGHTTPELEKGWSNIEAALQRARSLAQGSGAQLLIFPVPEPQEFLAEYPLERYRSRVLAMAEALQLRAFDPTPEMKAKGGGFARYFLAWDGHMNAVTHDLIARRLAEELAVPITAASRGLDSNGEPP